jgi:hypothetical protein
MCDQPTVERSAAFQAAPDLPPRGRGERDPPGENGLQIARAQPQRSQGADAVLGC